MPMEEDQKTIDAQAIENMLDQATQCDCVLSSIHQCLCFVEAGYSITEAANLTVKDLD